MAKVMVDGNEYELVHNFGNNRGIIDMGGVYALVDFDERAGARGLWELSGEPAREDEKAILQTFVDSVQNATKVEAPDGTVTTFTHEGGHSKR